MNVPVETIAIIAVALMAAQFWLFRREITYHQKQGCTQAENYIVARLSSASAGVLLDGAMLVIWVLGASVVFAGDFWQTAGLSGQVIESALVVAAVFAQAAVHRLLSAYRQFIIEHRFGFGRMTMALFLRDTFVQGILLLLVAAIFAWAGVILLSVYGPAGWLGVWVLWLTFALGKSWAYPIFIAPLFNRFSRLDDEDLTTRIDTLMARTNCDVKTVLVMDGSRRSSHGNAHVTGLGNAKRVVLLDTVLKTLKPDEIIAVLAHELGHIVHAHIAKFEGLKALTSFVWIIGGGLLLSAAGMFETAASPGFSPGWVLATLWLAVPVFSIIARPFTSWLVRRFEYQADAFVVAHDRPEALSRALLKLHKHNSAAQHSDTLFGFIYLSHPSLPDRLARLVAP